MHFTVSRIRPTFLGRKDFYQQQEAHALDAFFLFFKIFFLRKLVPRVPHLQEKINFFIYDARATYTVIRE